MRINVRKCWTSSTTRMCFVTALPLASGSPHIHSYCIGIGERTMKHTSIMTCRRPGAYWWQALRHFQKSLAGNVPLSAASRLASKAMNNEIRHTRHRNYFGSIAIQPSEKSTWSHRDSLGPERPLHGAVDPARGGSDRAHVLSPAG